MSYLKFSIYFILISICCESISICVFAEDERQVIQVTDDEFPHWRYWSVTENNDLEYSNTISIHKNGNIIINGNRYTLFFDGYTLTRSPLHIKPGTRKVFWNEDDQYYTFKDNIINLYSKNEVHSFSLSPFVDKIENSLQGLHNKIISFKQDQFYITAHNCLYFYDVSTQSFQTIIKAKDTKLDSFFALSSDYQRQGIVWIAGKNGIAKITLTKQKQIPTENWEYFFYPEPNLQEFYEFQAYPDQECTIAARKQNSNIDYHFIIQNNEIKLLHKEKSSVVFLGHDGGYWIRRINPVDRSFRFVYCNHGKEYEMKPNRFTRQFYTLNFASRDEFYILCEQGFARFMAPTWQADETLPDRNMTIEAAIIDSATQQYVVNHNNVLIKNGEKWDQFTIPREDTDELVTKLVRHPDMDGKISVITLNRIFVFDPKTQTFSFPPNQDFSMLYKRRISVLPNNNLLLASRVTPNSASDQLYLYDYKQSKALSKEEVHDIDVIDSAAINRIYVVLEGKLYCVRDGEFKNIHPDPNVGLDFINHIYIRKNGHLLLFSANNAMYEYDGESYDTLFPTGGFLSSINESEDNAVWYASLNGVYQFKNGIHIQNDWHEGLYDDRSNFIEFDQSGNVYAIGRSGFRRFHPEADRDPPETYIPEEENTKSFIILDSYRFRLSGRDRWDYTKPDRLLYSYKLNDGEWSDFQDSNTVEFMNLSPSNYTLYARAMDRNMNVDPTPAVFSFEIVPPWFRNPYYLTIFSIGIFLILFFAFIAYRNHMRLVHSLHQTQRTVSLLERTKDRLSEAKARAEEEKQNAINATKAKDGFLARMSHEIRTPLNGVIGNLELIPASDLKPEKHNYLQTAKVSANTLLDIIGDVLDFAKIEADKLELEEQSVSLHSLFQETISVMKTRAEEKEIALTSQISQNVPKAVRVDPVRLRQVMINLIGNAVKFTDQGSVNVSLTCESILEEIAVICFEVKDTGTGFDASRKDELFREFEQDDTSNKTAEGTGLGLAICKRIVEMMGGTIDSDSHPGFGSRFWITMPLRIIDESELGPTHTNDERTAEQPHFELKHPILVIDDKRTNLMLAKNQLSELHIDCDTAEGGQEALEKVKANAYSMILVDCSMPGMDGFEFTKKFRASKNGTQLRIPVIAMTAHVVSDIQVRCHAAGMDDYLSKPVRMDSLTSMLQKWLPSSGETPIQSEIEQDHVFSMEALSEFTSMRNPDDLVQYLTVVQQEMQSEYEQLLQAIQSQERMAFRDRVHGLKGLSESVRFTPFAEIMKQYQEEAGHISWESVENDLPKINRLLSQFHAFVQNNHMASELNKKDATENVSSNG